MDFAAACLDGGARLLQVRAKQLPAGRFLDEATAIVERAAAFDRVTVIVNDRADVAALAAATGVHVGQDDLTPAQARMLVGDKAVVGVSTHTSEQLDAALRAPVSHVAIGPIFGTTTKDTGYQPLGLAPVRAAASRLAPSGLPLVAIGGITLASAVDVIAAGASAVAVIGDLIARNPDRRVAEYLRHLSR